MNILHIATQTEGIANIHYLYYTYTNIYITYYLYIENICKTYGNELSNLRDRKIHILLYYIYMYIIFLYTDKTNNIRKHKDTHMR